MSAEVKADTGGTKSGEPLPKKAELPTDLFSQITFDCRGFRDSRDSGSSSPSPVSPLRKEFDAISVRVTINGQPFDVAAPKDTFDKSYDKQIAIAEEIGGRMATRAESRAVAEYLLAQKKSGAITEKETALLEVYRTKLVRDIQGGIDVFGVRVRIFYYDDCSDTSYGALVVCSSAEREQFDH
jgi:hypothetical protein